MFDWFRSLFAKPAPSQYRVLARGKLVYQARTLEEAEQFIKDQFDDQSSRAAQLRFFGTTRRQRWAAHRSQFRIDRIRD